MSVFVAPTLMGWFLCAVDAVSTQERAEANSRDRERAQARTNATAKLLFSTVPSRRCMLLHPESPLRLLGGARATNRSFIARQFSDI
jgi:hypothetical protein